ncbi:mobilization protein MbpA [Pricia sp.]|uniref:mobilization protein MbpA n=1 Tax=Pricia sp. TaxID=2268138 RepID=UPI003593B1CE
MKSKTVRFRCSTFERNLLRVKAKRSGLSLSEYCRRAAFEDRIIERLSEEQITMYKMLTKYRNNFIRIGNMFKKNNPQLATEVRQLAWEIRDHIQNFRK